MTELIERPLFEKPPGADIVAAFRRHLSDTSQPETFPQISTTRPPAHGAVVALFNPVNINKDRRPDRDMAPCPICSKSTGKYLSGGTLIWCEGSQAIYCVGPDCSASLWHDRRLDRALKVLRQTEQDKANALALASELQVAPARLDWIAEHRSTAAQIEKLHLDMAQTIPSLRGALGRALKGRSPTTPFLKGEGFLHGGWRLTSNLDDVARELRYLVEAATRGGVTWISDLADKEVAERLQRMRKAELILRREISRMNEAAAFLDQRNIEALRLWAATGRTPMEFTVTRTAKGVELHSMEGAWAGPGSKWNCPVGVKAPPPPP